MRGMAHVSWHVYRAPELYATVVANNSARTNAGWLKIGMRWFEEMLGELPWLFAKGRNKYYFVWMIRLCDTADMSGAWHSRQVCTVTQRTSLLGDTAASAA